MNIDTFLELNKYYVIPLVADGQLQKVLAVLSFFYNDPDDVSLGKTLVKHKAVIRWHRAGASDLETSVWLSHGRKGIAANPSVQYCPFYHFGFDSHSGMKSELFCSSDAARKSEVTMQVHRASLQMYYCTDQGSVLWMMLGRDKKHRVSMGNVAELNDVEISSTSFCLKTEITLKWGFHQKEIAGWRRGGRIPSSFGNFSQRSHSLGHN